jgi:hypothetical protein
MNLIIPPLFFYIPKRYWLAETSYELNWSGFGLGIYAWTLQTYLQLKDAGIPCQLVNQFPEAGVVFAHINSLRVETPRLQPGSPLLLVCLKAESPGYPYAQLQVVQNPTEVNGYRDRFFLPHWTQPDLRPRDPTRGDRFETLAFFGHQNSLAPNLQHSNWTTFLEQRGLRWCPAINTNHWNDYKTLDNCWNDYRQIDAVIAVRTLDRRTLRQHQYYRNKPATKLYNAWLAGVPAILGAESAYQVERQSDLDYLEVTSMADLQQAVQRLQSDRGLRQAMIENGKCRATSFTSERIRERWIIFLEEVVIPTYDCWRTQSLWQQRLTLHYSYWNAIWEKVQRKIHSSMLLR